MISPTASGDYFDNDLGEFSKPHSDVYDPIKCEVLVSVIERPIAGKKGWQITFRY